jgi:hypothetical protein
MAYKSQVTNKYMGAGFKGAPRSNRNPAATELGQIVSALKNDLTPAIGNWAEANLEGVQDAATKKMQKLYAEGKSSADINKAILAGDHPDLEHKYTQAVVEGQFGRIEAYETINNITKSIGDYKPRDQSLENFWQGYLPNFDEKGQFFTEGFAVVFNEYKAKALSKDMENRAIFQENLKINGIVTSLQGEYKLNGYQEGKFWKFVESFSSPLPFGGKKNYFVNNASKNKAMFLFIEDLVRTAETTEQLEDAEKLLDEARGGKHKLGTLAQTYNAEEVSKLRASIISREQWIADKSWTNRTREKILTEETFIKDYFAYLYGGKLSDGTNVDRNAPDFAEEEGAASYYDNKANETLKEMLEYDYSFATTLNQIINNVDNINRHQSTIEQIFIDAENGVYMDDIKRLTEDIAGAGGNMSDQSTIMSAYYRAKNAKVSGASLFPFLEDAFWQDSRKTVYNLITSDSRLITIEKDDAKRMIIANMVLNEYQKKVREFYREDPEPSRTLLNGNEWVKWNQRRIAFKIGTESAILKSYQTEQFFKATSELIELQDVNAISKTIASEASSEAIEGIVGKQVNIFNRLLSEKLATLEDIKETSAKTLTPISELSFITERVNEIKQDLVKAGITFLDDEEITKLLFKKLGIKDSDVNFDEAQAEMRTNIETLISEGFDKAMPQLVAQKDKILTFWKDESKLSTPESIMAQTEFLTTLFGEVTGLGKDFAPNVLLRMNPITLDLIAQSLNIDSDSFRTTLETIFKISLPSI